MCDIVAKISPTTFPENRSSLAQELYRSLPFTLAYREIGSEISVSPVPPLPSSDGGGGGDLRPARRRPLASSASPPSSGLVASTSASLSVPLGQAPHNETELGSKMLQIQSKRFYIDVSKTAGAGSSNCR
ncbi:uncharacterized protein LOC122373213, partial [Amphibalanus amphitrite]|uniref:uncharacterized protein LOC122373213 n=1 Tax=Amphibalanus amphitrite TaxID=1232801 RepID=UPI001C90EE44